MAADGDYIMVNKNDHITESDITTQNKTDMTKCMSKVYVTAKVCMRLIYIHVQCKLSSKIILIITSRGTCS